jgi:uncharacterized protein
VTFLDLRSVRLRAGEQFRDRRPVEIEPFDIGGQRYAVEPASPDAEITATRTTGGMLFELALAAHLTGPCFRCLDETELDVLVRGREYQAADPGGDDELTTPYLADDKLDLSAWARDAIALDLPDKILCREDCAGLCPECGRDLNAEPHEHETKTADPRWSELEKLRDRL